MDLELRADELLCGGGEEKDRTGEEGKGGQVREEEGRVELEERSVQNRKSI